MMYVRGKNNEPLTKIAILHGNCLCIDYGTLFISQQQITFIIY